MAPSSQPQGKIVDGKIVPFSSPESQQFNTTLKQTLEDTPCPRESERDNLLEFAMVIICNAGGGDWTKETPDWQEAARKFIEQYHYEAGIRRHARR